MSQNRKKYLQALAKVIFEAKIRVMEASLPDGALITATWEEASATIQELYVEMAEAALNYFTNIKPKVGASG